MTSHLLTGGVFTPGERASFAARALLDDLDRVAGALDGFRPRAA